MSMQHMRVQPRHGDLVRDFLAYLLTVWLEFWRRTDPHQHHEAGATVEFAADLHSWNTDMATARFRALIGATTISGNPALDETQWSLRVGEIEGYGLVGNPYDQNGGAL